MLFGQTLYHGVHKPDWSLRLYPQDVVQWAGIVHEQAHVSVPVNRLRHKMLHYTYTAWDRYFFKFNQYTTLTAEDMQRKGKRAGFGRDIVLRPLFAFFRAYLLKAGFLDGRLGFIMAVYHYCYTMTKYVKLYWLVQRKE